MAQEQVGNPLLANFVAHTILKNSNEVPSSTIVPTEDVLKVRRADPISTEGPGMSQRNINRFVSESIMKPSKEFYHRTPGSTKHVTIGTKQGRRLTQEQQKQKEYNERRKNPTMYVSPTTGLRYGKGVHRIPPVWTEQGKYLSTRAVAGGLVGGTTSIAQHVIDALGQKAHDITNLARLPTEERLKVKAYRIKEKMRAIEEERENRKKGITSPEMEPYTHRLARHGIFGVLTGAAVQTASGVNEIIGRHPKLYPIEIKINPDKMNTTLDWYYRRMKGDTFRSAAQAQAQYNEILNGIEQNNPNFNVPEAFDMLNGLKGFIDDANKYGEKKHGKNWIQNQSEKEKQDLIALTALARRTYTESYREALKSGKDNPGAYAERQFRDILGQHPIAMKKLVTAWQTYNGLNESNPAETLKNMPKHEKDFRERVKTTEKKIDAHIPPISSTPTGFKVVEGSGIAPEERQKYEEAQAPRAGIRFGTRGGKPTVEEKISEISRHAMKEGRGKAYQHFGQEGSKQLGHYFGLASTKGRSWKRTVTRGPEEKAVRFVQRSYPELSPEEAAQVTSNLRSRYKTKYGERPMETNKSSLLGIDINKVSGLRELCGILQSQGVLLNKQITSVPVEGRLLVRQDLHGGMRRRKKVYRNGRRIY